MAYELLCSFGRKLKRKCNKLAYMIETGSSAGYEHAAWANTKSKAAAANLRAQQSLFLLPAASDAYIVHGAGLHNKPQHRLLHTTISSTPAQLPAGPTSATISQGGKHEGALSAALQRKQQHSATAGGFSDNGLIKAAHHSSKQSSEARTAALPSTAAEHQHLPHDSAATRAQQPQPLSPFDCVCIFAPDESGCPQPAGNTGMREHPFSRHAAKRRRVQIRQDYSQPMWEELSYCNSLGEVMGRSSTQAADSDDELCIAALDNDADDNLFSTELDYDELARELCTTGQSSSPASALHSKQQLDPLTAQAMSSLYRQLPALLEDMQQQQAYASSGQQGLLCCAGPALVELPPRIQTVHARRPSGTADAALLRRVAACRTQLQVVVQRWQAFHLADAKELREHVQALHKAIHTRGAVRRCKLGGVRTGISRFAASTAATAC